MKSNFFRIRKANHDGQVRTIPESAEYINGDH